MLTSPPRSITRHPWQLAGANRPPAAASFGLGGSSVASLVDPDSLHLSPWSPTALGAGAPCPVQPMPAALKARLRLLASQRPAASLPLLEPRVRIEGFAPSEAQQA